MNNKAPIRKIKKAPAAELLETMETVSTRPAVERGLKLNETRATIIIDKDALETLKGWAWCERIHLKDVVGQAVQEYIERHVDKKKLEQELSKKRG